ncbi:MAG: hypothetical protein JWO03_3910 [Bacteroidetes bacterium]|nr:hypothetical protein [Bacteroidota bacterium]
MKLVVLMGRILFASIFLMTARTHFSGQAVAYASAAGVPDAAWLVPISGVIAILGGLSIILGYKAKIGAILILIFLIPVTYYMHAFWKQTDPMQMQMQMGNFIKNLSLMGTALLIVYFGSGPWSLDAKRPPKITVKGFISETMVVHKHH